ncbi:hypothetical protein DPMN_082659, partial [Dreissena polymorpha]
EQALTNMSPSQDAFVSPEMLSAGKACVYNKKTEETSTFYLGHERLSASDKYTHLGIKCNSFLTTNNAIHDACCDCEEHT